MKKSVRMGCAIVWFGCLLGTPGSAQEEFDIGDSSDSFSNGSESRASRAPASVTQPLRSAVSESPAEEPGHDSGFVSSLPVTPPGGTGQLTEVLCPISSRRTDKNLYTGSGGDAEEGKREGLSGG